jgi:hypothetical protein
VAKSHRSKLQKTSDRTEDYNCIAWAIDDLTIKIWPDEPGYFWPDNILQQESTQAFIEFFATHDYDVCASGDFEAGFEKIAIYVEDGEVTHAAKQLQSGHWSSKLGFAFEDIEHDTLEALEASGYGQATIFMKRHYL